MKWATTSQRAVRGGGKLLLLREQLEYIVDHLATDIITFCQLLDRVLLLLNTLSLVYTCENYKVERQRHNKQINYTQDSSFFKETRRAALGVIQTHDTLQSRRELYQLSYQGNSAGRGYPLEVSLF